jgi:translation initiation factor 2 alpha subunit (eIF-2alpha)
MTQMDKNKKPKGLFEQVAEKFGISTNEVVREIQDAIDTAWDNPDPAVRAKQRELFPNGKPLPEEFIRTMAKEADK